MPICVFDIATDEFLYSFSNQGNAKVRVTLCTRANRSGMCHISRPSRSGKFAVSGRKGI